jgi:hypothetical protein
MCFFFLLPKKFSSFDFLLSFDLFQFGYLLLLLFVVVFLFVNFDCTTCPGASGKARKKQNKKQKTKIHSGENKENGQGWDHLDEKKMGAASHDDRIVPAKRRLSLELKKTASIVHPHTEREREREKPKIFKRRRRRRREKRFVWRSRTRLASWTIVRCLAGSIGSSLFEVRLKLLMNHVSPKWLSCERFCADQSPGAAPRTNKLAHQPTE